MKPLQVDLNLARRVWRKLLDGPVPIVTSNDFKKLVNWREEVNERLRNHSYFPEIGHGFLGVQKGNGVTRFLPVLTKEDMAVYYQLCGEIGDQVIQVSPDIYGGWRSIPTPLNIPILSKNTRLEASVEVYQQNYSARTFSNTAWFRQFVDFNALLTELVRTRLHGSFVVTSDIANFYDSIDIGRLTMKLRRDAPHLSSYIDILDMFLSSWNRRISGYQRSSKGIPQEIISDASRNLSHYYLQDFDEKLKDYCGALNLRYVRWADDILIFGNSKRKLEAAVHNASKFLLSDGLNLSAPKTKIYELTEYAKYRGLDILQTIQDKDQASFQTAIKRMQTWALKNPVKLDTIFRASVGFTSELGVRATVFEKEFLKTTVTQNPELIGSLTTKQLYRLIASADDPQQMFNAIRRHARSTEITTPKANFVMLIKETANDLKRLGISVPKMLASLRQIDQGTDSDLIKVFCLPPALAAVHAVK